MYWLKYSFKFAYFQAFMQEKWGYFYEHTVRYLME